MLKCKQCYQNLILLTDCLYRLLQPPSKGQEDIKDDKAIVYTVQTPQLAPLGTCKYSEIPERQQVQNECSIFIVLPTQQSCGSLAI